MFGVGTVLEDRYALTGLIARGGMADVYRAVDRTLDRLVAVKVLRAAGGADTGRFDAEMRLLARLEHPHLVRLFNAGRHDGRPYLVLELVDGTTLAAALHDGPLDAERVGQVGAHLADALRYVHAHDIVHRDVNPANVLLDASGRTRLGDFGIARTEDATVTAIGLVTGTAAYLAPEQLTGDAVTPAADIYALGLVLLECLTGRREFAGTPQEAALARLARDPHVPDTFGPPWPALLTAMTARDPARRPTAGDVAAALAAPPGVVPTLVLAPTAGPALAPDVRAAPRRGRRRAVALGLAAAGVLAGVTVAALVGGGDGRGPASVPSAGPTTAAPTGVRTRSPAPPTTPAAARTPVTCAALEAEKKAIERQKQVVEDRYKDEPDTRERLKKDLEDRKKAVEARKRQARC